MGALLSCGQVEIYNQIRRRLLLLGDSRSYHSIDGVEAFLVTPNTAGWDEFESTPMSSVHSNPEHNFHAETIHFYTKSRKLWTTTDCRKSSFDGQ
jgi:hypothetical protein